jgi:hypothetical protein
MDNVIKFEKWQWYFIKGNFYASGIHKKNKKRRLEYIKWIMNWSDRILDYKINELGQSLDDRIAEESYYKCEHYR